MRIVKISILQNETKLRPGDFIRKVCEGISGRIKAFNFAFLPISNKVFKRIKVGKDTKQMEEIWKRSKRSKRSYFSKAGYSRIRSNGRQAILRGNTRLDLHNSEENKNNPIKMDYCKIKNDYTSSNPVTSTISHLDPHEISTEASIIVIIRITHLIRIIRIRCHSITY